MVSPNLSSSTYVAHTLQTLWQELPGLLWGALLFNLFCLPSFVLFSIGLVAPALLIATVTVSPALVALQAYQLQMLQGDIARTATFFRSVRIFFRRSASFGLLGAFPMLMLLTTLPALQIEPVPLIIWLGLGADLLGCALVVTLLLYALPLLSLRNESFRVTLRNAFILAGRYPSNTVGLVGMAILFGFGIVYLSMGLLLILPTIYTLFVVANSQLVIRIEGTKVIDD